MSDCICPDKGCAVDHGVRLRPDPPPGRPGAERGAGPGLRCCDNGFFGVVHVCQKQKPTPLPLDEWWRSACESDLRATVPKMEEYGASDLVAIGRDMADLAGWKGLTEPQYCEIGIAFYLRGKIARVMEAYVLKRFPSDDTWHDITVYSIMGRAARERGGWGDMV